MRTVPVLAGIAAVALAGFSVAAFAQNVHSMTLNLPGGGTEHITYTGNQAPKVVFYRGSDNPFAPAFFGWNSPFAALEHISANIDRQMNAMMRETATMPLLPGPSRLMQAEARNMPPGATSFSMVSTMSGNHVCTHTMRIITGASGKRHVSSNSSGDCSAAAMRGPANLSAVPLQPKHAKTIEVKSDRAPFRYSSGLVRAANYRSEY